MKIYNRIAIISVVVGFACLIVATCFGGTMFGYVNTENTVYYRLQHLYPLTYCFGALTIFCSIKMKNHIYAIIGLIEMLFLPLVLGLIFYNPDTMWIVH